MKRKTNIWYNLDWLTVGLTMLLMLLGWLNIYSAVYNEDHTSIFDLTQRYGKQMLWVVAAIVMAFIVLIIESKFYSFFAYLIYGIAILALLLVLVIGKEIHGSRSWFVIGGFQIQPSEFAKFATVLAVARYLSTFNVKINQAKTLVITAIIIFTPALLILMQSDTGSALVYTSLFIILFREGLPSGIVFIFLVVSLLFVLTLFVSTLVLIIGLIILGALTFYVIQKSFRQAAVALGILALVSVLLWGLNQMLSTGLPIHLIITVGLLLSGLIYLIPVYKFKIRNAILIFIILVGSIGYTYTVDYFVSDVLSPYQQKRINVLLGIESDPFGDGYNVNQSKIAIGSGGFSGKGYLKGTQTKFNFVPEQSTDFIFCTVGEEWGFIGSISIIGLFMFLMLRILMLAERQKSAFSRIYGYGVFSVIFFHFLVNIGMTIGLVPVIGIPLPFISYGGSSLWAFTLLLFILLRLDASRMEMIR